MTRYEHCVLSDYCFNAHPWLALQWRAHIQILEVITARKRSLRRLCFYRCVSVHRGGVLSQHALQVVSQHALQQRGCLLLWGGCLVLGGSAPGGGAWSRGGSGGDPLKMTRPTTRGEIEGDQIQAHSQGGNWGGPDPGPQPRGKLRGIRSRSTAKGEIEGDHIRPPPTATAAGGTHPTGMHSCCNCKKIILYQLLRLWIVHIQMVRITIIETSQFWAEWPEKYSLWSCVIVRISVIDMFYYRETTSLKLKPTNNSWKTFTNYAGHVNVKWIKSCINRMPPCAISWETAHHPVI